ncbi:MAG: hypothetical protein HZB39_13700 [Planctomycetes bacterium]|nr:hypothetical protein [Planctomycetota bacterium]
MIGHFTEWFGWCATVLVVVFCLWLGIDRKGAPWMLGSFAFTIGIACAGRALAATGQRRPRGARRFALVAALACGLPMAFVLVPVWLEPPPPRAGEDIGTASARLGERLVPLGWEAEGIVEDGETGYWYVDGRILGDRVLVVVRDGRIVRVVSDSR